jgi:hypothetical protein
VVAVHLATVDRQDILRRLEALEARALAMTRGDVRKSDEAVARALEGLRARVEAREPSHGG